MLGDHLVKILDAVGVLKPCFEAVKSGAGDASIHLNHTIFQVGILIIVDLVILEENPHAEKDADDEADDDAAETLPRVGVKLDCFLNSLNIRGRIGCIDRALHVPIEVFGLLSAFAESESLSSIFLPRSAKLCVYSLGLGILE